MKNNPLSRAEVMQQRTRKVLSLQLKTLITPIGEMLLLIDSDNFLRAADWRDYEARMQILLKRQYPGTEILIEPETADCESCQTMMRYFDGDLDSIGSLEVRTGGTRFQNRIWQELRNIPAGQTSSYGLLASRLGLERAARAVGMANGANPVGVVLPCHRMIGANGNLTGYGGGLERKRWLLHHEKVHSHRGAI